ncbi:universal stress protein [Tsukamurella strandjordii]|uniref:universal stress protein n=1 Tax=Tsukamurella strandjordii TaxID=147577 RepID=UPI0031D8D2EC
MTIFVAYLATDGGRDAVALGVQVARSMRTDLAVGMIVPPDAAAPITPGDFVDQVLTAQADEWLRAAVAAVPADVAVSTHVRVSDSPAEGIIAEAERLGADAVVIGGTGGGLLGSHSLGSVANDLIHSSSVGLLVAPRGYADLALPTIRRITCAVGTRAGADELLDVAIASAARAEVPLRLISLVAFDLMPGHRRADPVAQDQARDHAERVLDEARARLSGSVPVSVSVAVGPTVEDAVEQVGWESGDIIMVGSSRLAAPRRLFLGSTAAKMLRRLDVPMVVVPKEGI